jgi:hypothetical protein
MVDAAGTTAFTYYAGGLLHTEDGPWTSDTVTYTYMLRIFFWGGEPLGSYLFIIHLTGVTGVGRLWP